MNSCSALLPKEEQQERIGTAGAAAPGATPAGSNSAGGGLSSSSSGSPSWPPTSSNSASFFRQLFAEADGNSAVGGAAADSAAAAVSSFVDDLLLPPAAASAFDDSAEHVFQLGAFSMDSFINMQAATAPSLGLDHTTVSGSPHTLEFVTPPCSRLADTAHTQEPPYHSKPSPRHDQVEDDDIQPRSTSFATAAKKAKLQPADPQHCSTGAVVDPSQLQSIVNKVVNQSQSAARSKEKLGERINALQQLVSPFGKTDTASVLSEAIGYIKFLQEQVQVLSSPYMKPTSTLTSSSSRRQDKGVEAASDLRSRGLCLVPVSCTMNMANNNNFNIGADYWASTPNLSSTTASGATPARFSATT